MRKQREDKLLGLSAKHFDIVKVLSYGTVIFGWQELREEMRKEREEEAKKEEMKKKKKDDEKKHMIKSYQSEKQKKRKLWIRETTRR